MTTASKSVENAQDTQGTQGVRRMARLTETQHALVSQNLGLVAVHLRRNVANLAVPRRDREWEDLFQEGFLGLANAAMRYDAASGIPFAAYALPRIHNAVSRALQNKFSTVRLPPVRGSKRQSDSQANERDASPRVVELEERLMSTLCARKERVVAGPGVETVGERIRERIDWAVQQARHELSGGRSSRGDRVELIELLLCERILLPDPESRRPLRRIARDTHSSYARVAQCEKRLLTVMRNTLADDPELRVLNRTMRQHPDGPEQVVDDDTERAISQGRSREMAARYESYDRRAKAQLLHRLMSETQRDVGALVADSMAKLDPCKQRFLLDEFSTRGERDSLASLGSPKNFRGNR